MHKLSNWTTQLDSCLSMQDRGVCCKRYPGLIPAFLLTVIPEVFGSIVGEAHICCPVVISAQVGVRVVDAHIHVVKIALRCGLCLEIQLDHFFHRLNPILDPALLGPLGGWMAEAVIFHLDFDPPRVIRRGVTRL